ncbi:hypothetical protein QQM39_07795 [Streptomyces sp. DT2A-34]|uniref:hypothetical protein n=1 Tax=Streptomyces sp. DT2A-34 TaxID=3051182 RepID=UPI00265C76D1|nr:hypothetical protein [Streptomyces sp. DT2A-34]MDO0910756.1 hypothetical protein [Streptomyces sp. DT2A-34]
MEVLSWDSWGPEIADDASLTKEDLTLVDAVVAAGSEGESRRLYEDPRFTVPDEITSYTTYGGVRRVTLR